MLVNKLTNINMSKYANLFKNSLKIDNFLTKEISPFRFVLVDITTKKRPLDFAQNDNDIYSCRPLKG